jgi:hypothetical protein
MFSIKALAMATAVSAGVVFAMPVASQATPQSAPVKVYTTTNNNIVDVRNKKKSRNWWARHCAISNDVKCGRHYTKRRMYNEPYYGNYRPYRPYRRPGVTIDID